MFNSLEISNKIKELLKQKKIPIERLLSDIGLGVNTMAHMKTSMPSSENLAKIADYLDCSVDYLLGRDELARGIVDNDKLYISAETAERVKAFSKERGISITDLLGECKLNKNTVSSMQSRGSWIQANSLAKIADYLDCSVDYLLGREGKIIHSFDVFSRGIVLHDELYNSANIAERIKTMAKKSNIKINSMLDACNLSKNALSSMLSGGSMPKSENLAKIADYLDCSVDYLLGREEFPQKKASPSFDELARGIVDDATMAKANSILTSLSPANLDLALKFLDLLASQQSNPNI